MLGDERVFSKQEVYLGKIFLNLVYVRFLAPLFGFDSMSEQNRTLSGNDVASFIKWKRRRCETPQYLIVLEPIFCRTDMSTPMYTRVLLT